jgi:hypothetical protein
MEDLRRFDVAAHWRGLALTDIVGAGLPECQALAENRKNSVAAFRFRIQPEKSAGRAE